MPRTQRRARGIRDLIGVFSAASENCSESVSGFDRGSRFSRCPSELKETTSWLACSSITAVCTFTVTFACVTGPFDALYCADLIMTRTTEDLLETFFARRDSGNPVTVEELCASDLADREKLQQEIDIITHFEQLAVLEASHPDGDSAVASLASTASLPEFIGGFHILEVLGEGGMGIVYRAEDPRLGRQVALKVMKGAIAHDIENRRRFLREARAMAAIEHEHVMTVHAVAEEGLAPFLVMPVLTGETLEQRLAKSERLSVSEACRIGAEVAAGLAAAHARGLIHRDIKPSNIWLEGDRARVKLLDFGLARGADVDQALTNNGTVLGTPAYMAPEQAAGQPATPQSDLFSLGTVLYRMLTGCQPFSGETIMVTFHNLATKTPAPPAELDDRIRPELSNFTLRLINKSPTDRPVSADVVYQELKREAAIAAQTEAARAETMLEAGDTVRINLPSEAPSQPVAQSPSTAQQLRSSTVGVAGDGRPGDGNAGGPPRTFPWKRAFSGGLAALALAIFVITITKKDGTKTRIEVEGDVTQVEALRDGKVIGTLKTGTPGATAAATTTAPVPQATNRPEDHRRVAEWVISTGGEVQVRLPDGSYQGLNTLPLPATHFEVTAFSGPGSGVVPGPRPSPGATALASISTITGAYWAPVDGEIDHLLTNRNLQAMHLGQGITRDWVPKIANFAKLQRVYGLPLTDDNIDALTQLHRLENVDLPEPVTAVGIRKLKSLPFLSTLVLRSTEGLDESYQQALAELPGLKELYMEGRCLDQHLHRLAQIGQLESISLLAGTGSRLSTDGWRALGQLPKLRAIGLLGDNFAFNFFDAFQTMPKLQHLDLFIRAEDAELRRLRDDDILTLSQLTQLKKLKLQGFSINAAQVARLKMALPDCEIEAKSVENTEVDAVRDDGTIGKIKTPHAPPARTSKREMSPATNRAEDHRRVAEWVISAGGSVVVETDDGQQGTVLPKKDFKVRVLDLGKLDIPGPRPFPIASQLASIDSLRACYLDYSHARAEELSALLNNKELEILSIRSNTAGTDWAHNLASFPALKELYGLRVDETAIGSLLALKELRQLQLDGYANRRVITAIASLPQLETLYLWETPLNEDAVRLLVQAPSLTRFGTQTFDDLHMGRLGQMSTLKTLLLGVAQESKVTADGWNQLCKLRDLSELEISVTGERFVDLAFVESMATLKTLVFRSPSVIDDQIRSLGRAQALRTLRIQAHRQAGQLEKLQQALPNCKIEWTDD